MSLTMMAGISANEDSSRFRVFSRITVVLLASLAIAAGGCGERSPSRPSSQAPSPSQKSEAGGRSSAGVTDRERAVWRASITSAERSDLDTITDETHRDFYARSWSLLGRLDAGDKTVDARSELEALLMYVDQTPGEPADPKKSWSTSESVLIERGGVALSTAAKAWALYGPLPQIEDRVLLAIEKTRGNKDELIRLCRAWAAWAVANVRGTGPRSARAEALAAECLDDDYVESTLPIQLNKLRERAKASGKTLPPNPPPRAH